MTNHLLLSLVLAGFIFATQGCSQSAKPPNAPVEVKVTIVEYKFESSLTTFSTGTAYRFVIKNNGTTAHEWMIMPPGEKDETKALIKVEDGLKPGATVTRDFTFTQKGNFEFACHIDEHYEKGLKLPIVVK